MDRKKMVERLTAKADALEDGNYHAECEMYRQLAAKVQAGAVASFEQIVAFLLHYDHH